MAQPGTVPQPLMKTLVSAYIELAFDLCAILLLGGVAALGLFSSFSNYYGPQEDDIFALVFIFAIMAWVMIYAVFKLIVVLQLRKQKYWAWVASIVICGFNFFSFPYLILGIIKLVGLLNNESIAWFKANRQHS